MWVCVHVHRCNVQPTSWHVNGTRGHITIRKASLKEEAVRYSSGNCKNGARIWESAAVEGFTVTWEKVRDTFFAVRFLYETYKWLIVIKFDIVEKTGRWDCSMMQVKLRAFNNVR